MPLDALATSTVRREPVVFAEGLFGWYHDSDAAPRDVVAVLCAPFGPEYTRAHRTLRHLADRLASAGIAALRFDYHGVGDSVGDEEDPDRLAHWRSSIVSAAQHARALSGGRRVCLVGVRLGATLAALEASGAGADLLVLWNPIVKGRAYARELQAMAATAEAPVPAPAAGGLEAGGFRVSAQTLEDLRALELPASSPSGIPVFHIGRDDFPGWNDMLADHQFTVVPEEALLGIRDWITNNSKPGPGTGQVLGTGVGQVPGEIPVRFGPQGNLFGIVTRPATAEDKPAVVLLDAGSIHHVGPHRLYVRLARELARRGHLVLRFDFEGIGDSVLRGPGRENHPYSATAMEDLRAALDYLRAEHGCTRFAIAGVCSGAYNSYQAAFRLRDVPIEHLVLVNPWYFAWREGLSLATTVNHYGDVAAYGQSMRSLDRWKRLLRGEADVMRLARTVSAQARKKVKGWLFEAPLARELRDVEKLGRRVSVILSDGEPAHAILSTEAPRTFRRGLRNGFMTFDRVRGGDHTFSRAAHREALIQKVAALLG